MTDRRGKDFTRSRSDFGDAVIIALLTVELHCYVLYLPEGLWGRLRHLGAQPCVPGQRAH
jgi:hypothetical protein